MMIEKISRMKITSLLAISMLYLCSTSMASLTRTRPLVSNLNKSIGGTVPGMLGSSAASYSTSFEYNPNPNLSTPTGSSQADLTTPALPTYSTNLMPNTSPTYNSQQYKSQNSFNVDVNAAMKKADEELTSDEILNNIDSIIESTPPTIFSTGTSTSRSIYGKSPSYQQKRNFSTSTEQIAPITLAEISKLFRMQDSLENEEEQLKDPVKLFNFLNISKNPTGQELLKGYETYIKSHTLTPKEQSEFKKACFNVLAKIDYSAYLQENEKEKLNLTNLYKNDNPYDTLNIKKDQLRQLNLKEQLNLANQAWIKKDKSLNEINNLETNPAKYSIAFKNIKNEIVDNFFTDSIANPRNRQYCLDQIKAQDNRDLKIRYLDDSSMVSAIKENPDHFMQLLNKTILEKNSKMNQETLEEKNEFKELVQAIIPLVTKNVDSAIKAHKYDDVKSFFNDNQNLVHEIKEYLLNEAIQTEYTNESKNEKIIDFIAEKIDQKVEFTSFPNNIKTVNILRNNKLLGINDFITIKSGTTIDINDSGTKRRLLKDESETILFNWIQKIRLERHNKKEIHDIESLLKFGADPNIICENRRPLDYLNQLKNKYPENKEIIKFIELLEKYGGKTTYEIENPNSGELLRTIKKWF